MQRRFRKQPFPPEKARQYLEPGPVVLISSAFNGQQNIMTLGWQTVMEFSPSLVGCMITAANHTFEMVAQSHECVINVPTTALTDEVVGIGNCSGRDVDKFEHFGLTPEASQKVQAPSISECCAHFECRLYDDAMLERYNFFIWEVVGARVAVSPKHPRTLHYRGEGQFMEAGKTISRRSLFLPHML